MQYIDRQRGIGGGKSLRLKALRPYPSNNDAFVKIGGGGVMVTPV